MGFRNDQVPVSYIDQSDQAASNSSQSTQTFQDVPGYATWTPTPPVTKTYLLRVDLAFFSSVLPAADTAYFQVVVGGSTNYFLNAMSHGIYNTNQNMLHSFRVPVSLVGGNGLSANTIKLQWRTAGAGTTMNTNAASYRCFTLTG